MSRSVRIVVSRRPGQRPKERQNANGLRITVFSVCSIVVLAIGLFCTQSQPLQAGDEPAAGPKVQPGAAPPPSCFVADSRGTLKRLREGMAGLGARALAGLELDDPTEADVAGQSLMVESAKAGYQHALLARSAAEIALKEYQDGVFPQAKRTCETELELARTELESAERAIPQARVRYAKFKQVRTGSARDLARGWQFEVGEAVARLQEKKARFALDQAQSKLKVLVEYEKPKSERELMSRLENARSDELARRASWELQQSKLRKLARMQDSAKSQGVFIDQRKQTLALLDRAIPIEEQLSARLDPLKEGIQPAESLRNEVTNLTHRLQQIVDQAQDAQAAADLYRLEPGLRRAVGR